MTRQETLDYYRLLFDEASPPEVPLLVRELGEKDLFYFLIFILGRQDANNDWVFARCRELAASPNGYADIWAREHYKAVDVNESVPTPSGFKKHGDLCVGDKVYDRHGGIATVKARTKVYTDADCYRIVFDDGYSVVVSGDHLWAIEIPSRKRINGTNKRVGKKEVTMSTRELAGRDHSAAEAHKTTKRVSIALPNPAGGEYKPLSIDPYLFGVWLGDGTSAGCNITCGYEDYEEMFYHLSKCGFDLAIKPRQHCVSIKVGNGRQGDRTSGDFKLALRWLTVLNNKKIPKRYLFASPWQRLELLRGLMDSDGHANTRGTAVFTGKSEKLVNSVFLLAASLGLKPTRWTHYIEVNGKPYAVHKVSFQAYKSMAPFKLQRKVDRCKDGEREIPRRFVTSVEKVASRPVSCIMVDSEDGVYLIGENYVPTHNSTIADALALQDVINNPELTVGIFSYTRPIAKAFLRQIKIECEINEKLKTTWPDIFWETPNKEAPKWAEDDGLILKRHGNPKESTFEAWGLVDSQPTSKHFGGMLFDDASERNAVNTPEMNKKTVDAWELSLNLSSVGGWIRHYGTFYHHNDLYNQKIDSGFLKPRIYPATDDGTPDGELVLWDRKYYESKRKSMSNYNFNCQILCNPSIDSVQGFQREWLQFWPAAQFRNMNLYLLIDPASARKKDSDYTVFMVIGRGPDENYYIITMVRDRLSLTQKADTLFALYKQYAPHVVGYEKYGMQSDIEHFKERMDRENFRFHITELGGKMPKEDRITRLEPLFKNHKIYLPESCIRVNHEGVAEDLTKVFIDQEYLQFPFPRHDDMLDCLARIFDITTTVPEAAPASMFPQIKAENPDEAEYAVLDWA